MNRTTSRVRPFNGIILFWCSGQLHGNRKGVNSEVLCCFELPISRNGHHYACDVFRVPIYLLLLFTVCGQVRRFGNKFLFLHFLFIEIIRYLLTHSGDGKLSKIIVISMALLVITALV